MKYFAFLVLAVFLSVNCFSADWVSLSRSNETAAGKLLKSSTDSQIVVDINIPGYKASEKFVDGQKYTVLDLEGSSMIIEKGAPELRKVTTFVKVPKCAAVAVEVLDATYVAKEVAPVIPSKGNILRNVNPETVPYELGDAYKGGWYPADNNLVSVSEPFLMRDIYGVRLSVVPFQYNHETQTLKIYTKITVAVKPVGIQKAFSFNFAPKAKEFEALYEDMFINYTKDTSRGLTAPSDTKNLVIITHDNFYNAMLPLKEWKTKIGFKTDIVKLSEIGSTAADVQNFIKERFANGNLCHIILVGDDKYMPTLRGKYESAHADPCYVKLAGDDNIMDAFISRISVQTAEQAEYVVLKSINYEKYPMQGADAAWYKSTLGIASSEGNPKDYERVNELNAALKDNLGYKVTTCYDQSYYSPADKKVITATVNDGVNIIDYCGHGSETMWVSSRFNTSDARALKNGMKLPIIWSVACVNGAYVGRECFAEAWLLSGSKDSPAGCIGIAAATTNMAWVPPCVWQKHIITEETVKGKHSIAGVQHMYGVLKCMEEYGVKDKDYGNQLSEQTHYFGDGTVTLRFKEPKEIIIDKARDGEALVISARGVETSDCVVTVYDEAMQNVETKALTDGRATIVLKEGQTHFTVFGSDIVPIVDEEI